MRNPSTSLLALTLLVTACGGTDTTPPPPTEVASITVTAPAGTLYPGSQGSATAQARNSQGKNVSATFNWHSSSPGVATVNQQGVVLGVSPGTTTISATSGEITGSVQVTIQTTPPTVVTQIAVTAPTDPLYPGTTGMAAAVASNSQGQPLTTTLTWSSADPAIATVSSTGLVLGVSSGTTMIKARSGNVEGLVQVSIMPASLTRVVDSIRTSFGLPAMAVAVVGISSVESAVAGFRRADRNVPVTVNDKWHIGSNLKAQTAALAAIAVKAGKLNWTSSVADAFPELAGSIRPEYTTLTLQDLLYNRTGIPNNPPFTGATAKAQRESAVAYGLTTAPLVPLGTFNYSNVNFIIAGAMLERAWGGTYEDLMQSQLWSPTGVTSAGWGPTVAGGSEAQPIAHRLINSVWVPQEDYDNPPGLSAAGRAHMSIGDWARVVQEQIKADAGTSTLINPADGRKLTIGVTPIAGEEKYAMGWISGTRAWGGRIVTHEGSNLGNHSVAWVSLDQRFALLIATNSYADNLTGPAMDAMAGRLLAWRGDGK